MLDLGIRSQFRRVVDDSLGGDFGPALDQYAEDIARSASNFNESEQIKAALAQVMSPLVELLGIEGKDASEVIHFEPDGGSTSGLLRSLGIAVDLGDEAGMLPAARQGTTFATSQRVNRDLAASLTSASSRTAVNSPFSLAWKEDSC